MIYLFIFILAILFATRVKGNKWGSIFWMILSMLPLLIIAGYRDDTVGADVCAYPISSLEATSGGDIESLMNFTGLIEPLYFLLAWVTNIIDGKLSTLLLLTQIIITVCFYFGFYRLRKVVPFWLAVFMYCFLFYNMGLNMMRQSLAMSVVFIGFTYFLPDLGRNDKKEITKKQIIVFLIYIFIGFTFHKSALLAGLIIPVFYFKSKKLNYIYVFGAIIAFFAYSLLLSRLALLQGFEKLETYSLNGNFESAFSKSEFILRLFLLWFVWKKVKFHNSYDKCILTIFIIELTFNLFQLRSAFIGRIGYYFYMLYIPYLCQGLTKFRYRKRKPLQLKQKVLERQEQNLIKDTAKLKDHKRLKKSRLYLKKTPWTYSILGLIVFYWWFVYIISKAAATYPYTSKILGI